MANDNPTSFNEFEEKKWLISRLDLYHKNSINVKENELKEIEAEAEKIFSRFRGYRNNILSGLGVVLTVILGIFSAYQINQWIFYEILSILGVIGLSTIIIFNYITSKFESTYLSVVKIYNGGVVRDLFSQGFLISGGANLSTITISYLKNYFLFISLLIYANNISTLTLLEELVTKYKRFPHIKSFLMSRMVPRFEAEQIKKAYETFDDQYMPDELMEFIEDILSNYKSKKDNVQMGNTNNSVPLT